MRTMPFVASSTEPNGICWPTTSGTPFRSTVPTEGTALRLTPTTGGGSGGVGGAGGGKTGGGVGSSGAAAAQERWRTTPDAGVACVTVRGPLVTAPQPAFAARTR